MKAQQESLVSKHPKHCASIIKSLNFEPELSSSFSYQEFQFISGGGNNSGRDYSNGEDSSKGLLEQISKLNNDFQFRFAECFTQFGSTILFSC